jgi:hypothetical protein
LVKNHTSEEAELLAAPAAEALAEEANDEL